SEIGKLRSLQELSLRSNKLTGLPVEIFNIDTLSRLELSGGNRIRDLPKQIGKLTNLVRLSVNGNELTNIPSEISKLKQLQLLYLSNNKINYVPSEIGNLSQLRILYLDGNLLQRLPPQVGLLSKLTQLELSDNPLPPPPTSVSSKGVSAIRDYYAQLGEDEMDHLYEAKLLILGEGGAGKTTLTQKILDSNYQLKDEDTTKGIDIAEWEFLLDNDRVFKVNIWDFGGQEIYHATHQFFLTERSLYVLVVDTRKEDTDFYYWLNIAELLGGESPLVIFNNEKQDRKRAIDERSLREEFLNFNGTFHANLATNRGLEDTVREIQHYMQGLPHVGAELPKTWVNVRRQLEDDNRDYIFYEEYLDICDTVNLTEERYKEQVLGYLHDLGVCLHFKDDQLLRRYVILKPEWGTNAVYKVLDNERVIENWGEFSPEDLEYIWSDNQYNDMRVELLKLMMKFKLCYQIPDTSTYIAPQLLPVEKPDYKWDISSNLRLRYSYKFMPKGIVTQLIVALYDLISEQTVWRTGVVIQEKDTIAEIREYYPNKEIDIRIAGSDRKSLLAVIRREINRIHSRFHRLKVDELIPCNCIACSSGNEPFFHSYSRLRDFRSRRIQQSQCGLSGEMVNVGSLIDDVIIPTKEISQDISFVTYDFDVFISHSSRDNPMIERVIKSFKRHNIKYWLDNEQIKPDSKIVSEIERGIETSRHFLICLSPNYVQSEWCKGEYRPVLNSILSRVEGYSVVLLNLEDMDLKETPLMLREWKQTNYRDSKEYTKLLEFLKAQR
ncbi:MAG: COR domain-containing protein, partial [Chloroflexota bacterium]